jgi:hypothetical protein
VAICYRICWLGFVFPFSGALAPRENPRLLFSTLSLYLILMHVVGKALSIIPSLWICTCVQRVVSCRGRHLYIVCKHFARAEQPLAISGGPGNALPVCQAIHTELHGLVYLGEANGVVLLEHGLACLCVGLKCTGQDY